MTTVAGAVAAPGLGMCARGGTSSCRRSRAMGACRPGVGVARGLEPTRGRIRGLAPLEAAMTVGPAPLGGLRRLRVVAARAAASGAAALTPEDDEDDQEKLVVVPKFLWRSFAAVLLAGQVVMKVLTGKVHMRNLQEQLEIVGPKSLGVCLLTSGFLGMVFTIQFVREFARLGLTRSVGGVLALALSRELTPVVTAIIIAGRVGSAFAAELGTMQVSEQTDSLRMLNTDPVDYLITPRVLACCIAMPALTLLCFTVAMGASVFLADVVYDVAANVILDSAQKALVPWDIISALIKSWVFGAIIAVVSCSWGMTTTGGAKGVGESTTSAVVISLVLIFILDFVLSFAFFQGGGDALTQLMT